MYPLSRSREIGISFTEHRLWRFVNGELQLEAPVDALVIGMESFEQVDENVRLKRGTFEGKSVLIAFCESVRRKHLIV